MVWHFFSLVVLFSSSVDIVNGKNNFGSGAICQRAKLFYSGASSNYSIQTFLSGITLNVAVSSGNDILINQTTNEPYGGFSYDLLLEAAARGNFNINFTVVQQSPAESVKENTD